MKQTLSVFVVRRCVQCQTHVVCCNRGIITVFVFRVDTWEIKKKEGKYCIWDPDNSIYVQDDLNSITVPLYLMGAKLFCISLSD